MRIPRVVATLPAVALAALAACGSGSGSTSASPTTPSTRAAVPVAGATATGSGRGGVRLVQVGRFDSPLYVTQPTGERRLLFVVEQGGRIRVVRRGRILSRPFLDLSSRVSSGGERGLLSMAFAPDYRRSRKFYVDYTDRNGDSRIVEYRRSKSSPTRANSRSARQLLFVRQPFANHNGGLVLFGPDRLLYIGFGDGGSADDPARNGQKLSTLLGKILRIQPIPASRKRSAGRVPGRAYRIPSHNPFVGTGGARPEIYSYGLRNPWRFSFDSSTGALLIGDVGQENWEEVDYVPASRKRSAGRVVPGGRGANFGWSAYEGNARFNSDQQAPGHIAPIFQYSHSQGCSITGGYVVRNRSLPTLYGRYLYGDFCKGDLHSFIPSSAGARDDVALGLHVDNLSSFGQDSLGRIYATSLSGPVYRLAPE